MLKQSNQYLRVRKLSYEGRLIVLTSHPPNPHDTYGITHASDVPTLC